MWYRCTSYKVIINYWYKILLYIKDLNICLFKLLNYYLLSNYNINSIVLHLVIAFWPSHSALKYYCIHKFHYIAPSKWIIPVQLLIYCDYKHISVWNIHHKWLYPWFSPTWIHPCLLYLPLRLLNAGLLMVFLYL